jgi:hypothetical protein
MDRARDGLGVFRFSSRAGGGKGECGSICQRGGGLVRKGGTLQDKLAASNLKSFTTKRKQVAGFGNKKGCGKFEHF